MNEEDINPEYYENEIKDAKQRLTFVFQINEEDEFPKISGLTMEVMYDHLLKNVFFPFKAEYAMPTEDFRKNVIVDIDVTQLLHVDESPDLTDLGIICTANYNEQEIKVPLAEVVIKQEDPNFHLVEDYCIWFWNEKNA